MNDVLQDLLARRTACAKTRCELVSQLQDVDANLQSLDRVIELYRDGVSDHAQSGCNGYDLIHTRVRCAWIDSTLVPDPNWNYVLHLVAGRLPTREKFSQMVTPSWCSGVEANRLYIERLDLSYHGFSAPAAWKAIIRVAGHLRLRVKLEVQWLRKEGSQHPGRTIILDAYSHKDRMPDD